MRGQPSHDGQGDQQPWSANVYFCLSKKETLDHYKVPEVVQAWIGSTHSNRCSNNLKKKKILFFFSDFTKSCLNEQRWQWQFLLENKTLSSTAKDQHKPILFLGRMNSALINLGHNFLKLAYSLGQQLYLTLIYSSMAILWILELLLLYNLYNQSWTDFASRINDHLVVKWIIGTAFSIHYRPDGQWLLSLTAPHPELRADTALLPPPLAQQPNKQETMRLLAPVLPVAQIVRLSVQTQHVLPEDIEHCWALQMLTDGHPICSRFIQTLKPSVSVTKEQIQVLHLLGHISSGRIWTSTLGTNP